MKFSFPSFTNIENLIERGDGVHYIKYSKYPFSGFFSTVCFDEKNKNQKEQIKHNELHCYKEGLLIAWTGFYAMKRFGYPMSLYMVSTTMDLVLCRIVKEF